MAIATAATAAATPAMRSFSPSSPHSRWERLPYREGHEGPGNISVPNIVRFPPPTSASTEPMAPLPAGHWNTGTEQNNQIMPSSDDNDATPFKIETCHASLPPEPQPQHWERIVHITRSHARRLENSKGGYLESRTGLILTNRAPYEFVLQTDLEVRKPRYDERFEALRVKSASGPSRRANAGLTFQVRPRAGQGIRCVSSASVDSFVVEVELMNFPEGRPPRISVICQLRRTNGATVLSEMLTVTSRKPRFGLENLEASELLSRNEGPGASTERLPLRPHMGVKNLSATAPHRTAPHRTAPHRTTAEADTRRVCVHLCRWAARSS
ncbi:hypothetical protein CSOJ01_01784 [Colletotrichum sojae]|uniref:Uncharacterized protein n=1 Tax=Colletotrichum sojae TaxID=2175907 RepID=A0A8H6JSP1_9PEZI|nr:hypothetical protein CSOJ01_01784 [Colletotrichum sojae]